MSTSSSGVTDPLRVIRHWVEDRIGIYYPEHKLGLLEGRLQSFCHKNRLTTLEQLLERLEGGQCSKLELDLAHAVSTNHTGFFREPTTFDFFRTTMLPSIRSRPLRVWSAAASTGEEAYSLAMLAIEHFGAGDAGDRCAILGTDISAEVIQVAEQARYGRVDGVPPTLQQRYVTELQRQYAIHPSVARLCTFRRLNLMLKVWPFRHHFQVIFLRNVLYYFEPAQQRDLLLRLYRQTEPDGWLVTSVTESLRSLDVPWQPIRPGVFRKGEP